MRSQDTKGREEQGFMAKSGLLFAPHDSQGRLTPLNRLAVDTDDVLHYIYVYRNAFRVKNKWFTKSHLANYENYSSKASRPTKLTTTKVLPLYHIF